MTTICVDAVGGDEKPEVVLEGIAAALAADSDLSVLVAGPAELVEPFCAEHERALPLACTEIIGMEEHPADAVRQKKDSSIVRGCAAVKAGEADGFFSAGSTGAILAAATLGVGRIKGIKRPAIASTLPGASGAETVLLDLGANADCRPEMIVQFAQMGIAYSMVELGRFKPTVALLSNGSEEAKGNEQTLAFHEALAAEVPGFVGNCEGNDILAGRYDVVVCDGFIVSRIKAAAGSSFLSKLGAGLLKPAIKALAGELSGDERGGAMLLGLKAPVLIGHGATSVSAVKNGTLATARAVRADIVGRIAENLVR